MFLQHKLFTQFQKDITDGTETTLYCKRAHILRLSLKKEESKQSLQAGESVTSMELTLS